MLDLSLEEIQKLQTGEEVMDTVLPAIWSSSIRKRSGRPGSGSSAPG